MNAYTNVKKLTMDEARKRILTEALEEAKSRLPIDMQRIYGWILDKAEHMPGDRDRIMLTASECDCAKNALERYESIHGASDPSRTMLLQLTHTRKEFQAMCAANRENRIAIDVDKALGYLSDNYGLDETSMQLYERILRYWNTGRVDDAISVYLTDLLGPIGFDESDVDRMSKKGILES